MKEEKQRKIFISAHPADRYGLIEQVAEAIGRAEGCTALYHPAPSDRGPFLPEGVDTLVVLASIKYFAWANSGYISELQAAQAANIPIIPIAIEAGQNLTDLINMRCGKVQYIDAAQDGLALSLDALTARLCAVGRTVDESLPSVFISYRRADREAMLRLVESIKASPYADRINLWYDMIIEPGENYSLSILSEIKRCRLFVLLVTPRLLEPSNYVFRVEYKLARKLGKRILSIEAEPTDRRALGRMYPTLGKMADIKHPDAISAVLGEIVREQERSAAREMKRG